MRNEIDYIDTTDSRISETWWQRRGLMYTATGYGKKIPTEYMVQCGDLRWRRVYCHIFSNSGTLYVIYNGKDRILSIQAEYALEGAGSGEVGEAKQEQSI